MINQHTNAEFVGAPEVLTKAGMEAIAPATKTVTVSGTNAEVGVILDATPTVLPNKKLSVKIRSELRELVNDPSPSIRVTSDEQTTQPGKGGMIIIHKAIGDGSETLLVFVDATFVQTRMQRAVPKPK